MIECREYPEELKEGEITSLFKNQDAMANKNYRPITIPTSESKIFEQIMNYQKKFFFPFSRYLCGFGEHSTCSPKTVGNVLSVSR